MLGEIILLKNRYYILYCYIRCINKRVFHDKYCVCCTYAVFARVTHLWLSLSALIAPIDARGQQGSKTQSCNNKVVIY